MVHCRWCSTKETNMYFWLSANSTDSWWCGHKSDLPGFEEFWLIFQWLPPDPRLWTLLCYNWWLGPDGHEAWGEATKIIQFGPRSYLQTNTNRFHSVQTNQISKKDFLLNKTKNVESFLEVFWSEDLSFLWSSYRDDQMRNADPLHRSCWGQQPSFGMWTFKCLFSQQKASFNPWDLYLFCNWGL